MKRFVVLILLVLASYLVFSQRINVRETTERIGGDRNNAFVVPVYQVSERDVERQFRRFLRSNNAKVNTRRGEMRGEGTELSAISDRPINVFAKFDDKKENTVEITVAFDLGGAFLSSGLHPSQADAAKRILQDFSRELTSEAFSEIIREQERDISRRDRQFSRLVRDKEDLEKENRDLQRSIERNTSRIEDLEKEIASQKKDLKERKDALEEIKKQSRRTR